MVLWWLQDQGKEVWTSGATSNVRNGVMNDTGNFVLVSIDSRKIWESFTFPGDTLLPTQVIKTEEAINSRMSKSNFSGGRFQLRLIPDGNLVLNTRDMFSSSPLDAYYTSGTRDPLNNGSQLIFDATGYLYILKGNGERSNLTSRDTLPSGENYYRATLDSDGVFTQYYHPKDPADNTDWRVIWFEPKNICDRLPGTVGAGACGLNSLCSLDNNSRPNCECPQGFSLVDSNDPNGNCNPDYTPSCGDGYMENQFDLKELTDIDWPNGNFERINPTNEENCKTSCLKDCFCAVATFSNDHCWKKILPLFNGKKDRSLNVTTFLKLKKGPNTQNPQYSRENRSKRSLIYVGPVLLSTFVFIFIVLISVICVGFFQIHKRKARKQYPRGRAFETSLPRFTYQELVIATNGFEDVLGKGAFGIVYKGSIGTKIVAVKKLDRVFQDGEKEFQTEVNAIARTHHKNLVQLVGYCNDGEERLLIYEYMSNDTLAVFLFGDIRPSWKQRSNIAVCIAMGLQYLHEECSTQVIHCDIKPQNILLDEYYNPKISDFGLAKLLMINQSRTSTGIRGTKGYVAPEWFRNTLVTVKVDVYSFGVLLLEIISCRKSLHFESGNEEKAILTDWAWDCYREGRLDTFVGNDLEALDDYKRLKTFVMVAIWCVQEMPSLRPTMRQVIQMLEGIVEVSEPPCPFLSLVPALI